MQGVCGLGRGGWGEGVSRAAEKEKLAVCADPSQSTPRPGSVPSKQISCLSFPPPEHRSLTKWALEGSLENSCLQNNVLPWENVI